MKNPARLCVFLLGALLLTGQAAAAPPKGILELEGDPAPPLALSDLDGNEFTLEPNNKSWRFVHFWASWCGPCRAEMPAIRRMAQTLDGKNLQVILINTAENEDTVFTFLAEVQMDLPTLMDRDGLATEAWSPRGLPATYLVDPQGRLRYQALGGRPWDQPVYLEFLRKLSE